MVPLPTRSDAVEHARVLAVRGLVVGGAVVLHGREALDGHVAGVVVQGRDHAAERDERVGRRAAEHAAVHGAFQGLDLDVAGGHAAQRRRERRHAEGVVADVADHDDVRLEQLGVGPDELLDAAVAALLLALDEDLDADGAVLAEGEERAGVHDDAALVVGGAAAVEAAVALGGLERRARPGLLRAGRLHVVVRVEQDGGSARRAGRSPNTACGARGTSSMRTSGRPASVSSAATAAPVCSTGAAGKPGNATDGRRTSFSSSARSRGIRSLDRLLVGVHGAPCRRHRGSRRSSAAPGRTAAAAPPTRRRARRWSCPGSG